MSSHDREVARQQRAPALRSLDHSRPDGRVKVALGVVRDGAEPPPLTRSSARDGGSYEGHRRESAGRSQTGDVADQHPHSCHEARRSCHRDARRGRHRLYRPQRPTGTDINIDIDTHQIGADTTVWNSARQTDPPGRSRQGSGCPRHDNDHRSDPADVTVDKDGRYAATLAAGFYHLTGRSPTFNSNSGTCIALGPARAVMITPGSNHVDVICLGK